MAYVQKLDFVIRRKDLQELIDNPDNEVLRITLGITSTAAIEISAEGGKLSGESIQSHSITICPVPPDCPQQ